MLVTRTRKTARLRRIEPVLRRALRGESRVPAGGAVVVAVSGGADSTALLAGLHSIASEFGLTLHAAHLHHGLRGAAADADLDAVRALCARLGLPLHAARVDARRVMARRGWSGEDGLRRLRRSFLLRVARATGAAAIATAHTADDQLETLLMRLARGAGLRGLGGMRERQGGFIKPMLAATRAEVEADLARARLGWREDASNASRDHTRNRIRLDVIPALLAATGTRRPGLARRAAAAAAEVREAERILAAGVRPRLARSSRIQRGVLRLDSRGVAPYPSAARRLMLRLLWNRLTRATEGLTRGHLDDLCRLIDSGGEAASVRLPGGYRAVRQAHEIVIGPGSASRSERTGLKSTPRHVRHQPNRGANPT